MDQIPSGGLSRLDGADLVRMLDAVPAGFCFLDPEWRFRFVNAHAERLLGRSRGEVVGRTMGEVCPDTVGGIVDAAFRTAVTTGEPVRVEATCSRSFASPRSRPCR